MPRVTKKTNLCIKTDKGGKKVPLDGETYMKNDLLHSISLHICVYEIYPKTVEQRADALKTIILNEYNKTIIRATL